jgi:hypothetical protein
VLGDPRLRFVHSVSDAGDASVAERLCAPITITVSAQTLSSRSGQALVYQLGTLLSRLFDFVDIEGDSDSDAFEPLSLLPLPGLEGPILTALRRAMTATRKRDADSVRGVAGGCRILVGLPAAGGSSSEQYDLYVGCSAWTASLSVIEPIAVTSTDTPLGALAAGALAASEAFKQVFGAELRGAVMLGRGGIERLSISLLTYDVGRANAEEPLLSEQVAVDLTLFGCGSLGCAFVLGLLATPQLRGAVTTVDNGVFDERNPFKYSLLDAATAEAKQGKAVWASRLLLAHGNLTAGAFRGTATEFVAAQPASYRIPLAVAAVDTVEARFAVQDTLPARIVNAGVSGTTVEVSVHGFGIGPCLACIGIGQQRESWSAQLIAERIGLPIERTRELILGNLLLTESDVVQIVGAACAPVELLADAASYVGEPVLSFYNRAVYGQTEVTTSSGAQVQVTAAFVSAFAGVLLLAEMLKEASPELRPYRLDNSYRQDLIGVPGDNKFRYPREASGWCLCHSHFRQLVHREKYGETFDS